MKIGNREFQESGKTYVCGILNVTPDSFSDGGKWVEQDKALFHVEEMIKDGMDLLDIGGESTRPGGYRLLSCEEELGRVLPVIEAVKKRFHPRVPTASRPAEVPEEGVNAGIDFINDIWGLKWDKRMADVIAKSGLPCCLMHNRKEPVYESFMQDVAADLAETLHIADKAGIAPDKILLDPGVGFGKTYEQNLQIINNVESLKVLGCPIFLATSRKSVIGLTLDVPVTERVEGTLVTTVMGVMKGCMFVRVHDIKENVRAIRMTEAILNS